MNVIKDIFNELSLIKKIPFRVKKNKKENPKKVYAFFLALDAALATTIVRITAAIVIIIA